MQPLPRRPVGHRNAIKAILGRQKSGTVWMYSLSSRVELPKQKQHLLIHLKMDRGRRSHVFTPYSQLKGNEQKHFYSHTVAMRDPQSLSNFERKVFSSSKFGMPAAPTAEVN